LIKSTDRPKIEFKIACDVTESVGFGKVCGFYDVTGNFELDFRAMKIGDPMKIGHLLQ